MSLTLTVTAKGQVTLRKKVLEHLGARKGDRVRVDLLSEGRVQLRSQEKLPMSSVFGRLHREGMPALSIEEMNEVIAAGWAGEK